MGLRNALRMISLPILSKIFLLDVLYFTYSDIYYKLNYAKRTILLICEYIVLHVEIQTFIAKYSTSFANIWFIVR